MLISIPTYPTWADRLDAVASLIQDRRPYMDTLQLWLRETLSPLNRSLLERSCDRVSYFRIPDPNRWSYCKRLLLQRPTLQGLRDLQNILREPYAINRVDIALDLHTADVQSAFAVQQFLEGTLVQRWRGKRRFNKIATTSYWSAKKYTRRNIALYSDKPSKLTGQPCCHLEIRWKTADSCQRAGFRSITDLLEIDYRRLWQKELYLWSIDSTELRLELADYCDRFLQRYPRGLWVGKGQYCAEPQYILKYVSMLWRRALDCDPGIDPIEALHIASAQKLRDFSIMSPRRGLRLIPNDAFLPDALINKQQTGPWPDNEYKHYIDRLFLE